MSAGSSTGETVQQRLAFDALVVGGGIAGLQSAIELGDQGYKVLIVEKAPSIGGKMIGLSKVFPTLDCSSCICTPRMAAAAHHENITIFTYSEVKRTERAGSRFQVEVVRNPRYVHEADCIGCRLCEYACPIHVEHEFEGNLGARKAVYVPFANAIPQLALVDLEHCVFCGLCEKACPTHAIDFLQQTEEVGSARRGLAQSQEIDPERFLYGRPVAALLRVGAAKDSDFLEGVRSDPSR